jgi:hypothetical protein
MSSEQLTQQLMTMPLSERVELAQALWQSIDEGLRPGTMDEEREAVEQANRRDAELASGEVVGRSHQEVMEAARRVLGCD